MYYNWRRYRAPNFHQRDWTRCQGLMRRRVTPNYEITYLRVFKRDKGICGICKRPVNFRYFEIDHIIPTSKGGKDEWDNVQVSHKECNSSKGDSILDPTLYPNNLTKKG